MKPWQVRSAAGTLIFLTLVPVLAPGALGQAPPAPPPPVSVSGGGTSAYHVSEGAYGGNGDVLFQEWRTRFEASDAVYEIAQARVVLTPPKGDDIEDLDVLLISPSGRCRLIDWQPTLNSKGWTLSGGLNLDNDAGVNVGVDVTVGEEGVQVESAGPNEAESAQWTIDLDDASQTAAQRISLSFFALWRCPKDVSLIPITITGASLWWEIDSWGTDEDYHLRTGTEERVTEVAMAAPGPDVGDAALAAVVDAPEALAFLDGETYRQRVRVYGSLDALNGLEVLAGPGMQALEWTGGDAEADVPWVEYSGRLAVPLDSMEVVLAATIYSPLEEPIDVEGATVPVVQPLGPDPVEVSFAAGDRVLEIPFDAAGPMLLRVEGNTGSHSVGLLESLDAVPTYVGAGDYDPRLTPFVVVKVREVMGLTSEGVLLRLVEDDCLLDDEKGADDDSTEDGKGTATVPMVGPGALLALAVGGALVRRRRL